MLKFDVTTIPHDKQRYPTVGDYTTDGFGVVHFRISNMQNWRYELLVAVHEIVEKYLVAEAGISEEAIDKFDIEYEKYRPEGDDSEPGNEPDAPYYVQHQVATAVEKYLASILGVNWDVYDKVVSSL